MNDLDLFLRMGAALAIGLLIGSERGWHSRDADDKRRAAGLRTFGLTGLLGGISAQLATTFGNLILAAAFLGFTAVFLFFNRIEATARNSASATTTVAGLATFLLGALAVSGQERLAIAAAVVTTAILVLRDPLHNWIARVTWDEIRAVLILLVMSFLLLPILPNRAIDPWGAVNPYEVWLLAILIALISFAGYVAVRLFGERTGIILTAAAGGLASSTATTVTLARLARTNPNDTNLLTAGIAVSSLVMLLRVGFVALILNQSLAAELALPLLAGAAAFGLGAWLFLRVKTTRADADHVIVISNPLEFLTSLRLAGFIALVMLLAQIVRLWVGDAGLLVVAAVSGLADVDAITISLARMPDAGPIAVQGILLAVVVNTFAKALIAARIGGLAIGLRALGMIVPPLVAGSLALVLV